MTSLAQITVANTPGLPRLINSFCSAEEIHALGTASKGWNRSVKIIYNQKEIQRLFDQQIQSFSLPIASQPRSYSTFLSPFLSVDTFLKMSEFVKLRENLASSQISDEPMVHSIHMLMISWLKNMLIHAPDADLWRKALFSHALDTHCLIAWSAITTSCIASKKPVAFTKTWGNSNLTLTSAGRDQINIRSSSARFTKPTPLQEEELQNFLRLLRRSEFTTIVVENTRLTSKTFKKLEMLAEKGKKIIARFALHPDARVEIDHLYDLSQGEYFKAFCFFIFATLGIFCLAGSCALPLPFLIGLAGASALLLLSIPARHALLVCFESHWTLLPPHSSSKN